MPAFFQQPFSKVFFRVIFLSVFSLLTSLIFANPFTALAAPNLVPSPSVSVSVPNYVQIGEGFNISLVFSNTDSEPGYGPFIDLYISHGGADGLIDEDPDPLIENLGIDGDGVDDDPAINNALDGIFPASGSDYTATYLGASLEVTTITFPDQGDDGRGCVEHPLAVIDNAGTHDQVCGFAGDQLVIIELPFGSFTQDQPPVNVEVPVKLSEFADLNDALSVRARGGFQYGATPTVDFCCPPYDFTILSSDLQNGDQWPSVSEVIPTIANITKSGNGSLPTGPNYPDTFDITLDIAANQTITNLQITDVMDSQLTLTRDIMCTPLADTCALIGDDLLVEYASFTGTSATADITISIGYYIEDILASNTANPLTINNTASYTADWYPSDNDYTPDPPLSLGAPGVGSVTAVGIEAYKNTSQVSVGELKPGARLQHTITFNISDYFAFDLLQIEDTFSDGQRLDSTSPTLSITYNGTTYSDSAGADYVDVACNYSGGFGAECENPADDPPTSPDGTTSLSVDVSAWMVAAGIHPDGQMIGGLVNDGTVDTSRTYGTFTYYTIVQDSYTDRTGELSLNSNDSVSNTFELSGNLLDATTCTTGTCTDSFDVTHSDAGSTTQTLPKLSLEKSVYAVNGGLCSVVACENISPGDLVTYRLKHNLLTGDFEDLVMTDYLPLPIYHVADPLEIGDTAHVWFEDTVTPTIPQAGSWRRGPDDTQNIQNVDPSVSTDAANNALSFDFGTHADPANPGYVIDLIFTVTVSNEPFADGLKLTNQVLQSEQNTGAQTSSGTGIVQITLNQPVLVSEKSAVSTDNPNVADYAEGGISFEDPGNTGTPWAGGVINSSFLDTYGLNADISGVDASDLVKFVIVIENSGGSGGFDITLRDVLPSGFVIPAGGINLQVYQGNGTPLTFTGLDAGTELDLFSIAGIQVVDPGTGEGACQAHALSSGENVVLVTYDIQVDPNAPAGQTIENLGELVNYAGDEGGDPHLEEPQDDGATTVLDVPDFSKTLLGTRLNNITNASTEVVIGELVFYQLKVILPEGTIEDFRLIDQLAPLSQSGLAFVGLTRMEFVQENDAGVFVGDASGAIKYTGGDTYAGPPAAPLDVTSNGQTLTFDFGTLTNADNDNSLTEVLYIEYDAVVLDIAAMQSGDNLQNQATMYYDTYTWNSESGEYDLVDDVSDGPISGDAVTVIEPTLEVSKVVENITTGTSSYDAGDTIRYTFTIQHTGGSETAAYNVAFWDLLPYNTTDGVSKLDINLVSPSITVTDSKNVLTDTDFQITDTLSGYRLEFVWPAGFYIEPGRTITITLDAQIYGTASPAELFANTANLTWTSLPDTDSNPNSGADEVGLSTYNPDAKERTGEDGVGGALDDYAAASSANFSITSPTISKVLLGTEITNANNLANEVVIGEMATYQVTMTVPEGVVSNAYLYDFTDYGLALVDIVGIDYGSALTHTLETLSVSNGGRNLRLDFGTITNSDRDLDTTDETITVQYRVVAVNVSAMQSGVARNNAARFYWEANGSLTSVSASAPNVLVQEPTLEVLKTSHNVDKGLDGQYDAGDTIRYTITFQHAAGSQVEAYDVDFWDTLPADGKLIGLSITGVNDSAGVLGIDDFTLDTSADPDVLQINTSIDTFEIGRTVTITLEGDIYTTPYPGEVLANTANVTWTSLPDTDGTPGSGTDEIDRSTYYIYSDERDGSDGDGGALNDYADTTVRNVQIEDPGSAKYVFDTDQAHTQDAYLVIGETVTFAVRVTLPESLTPTLNVIDYLPAGLQYVPNSQGYIADAASSKGLLLADFDYNTAYPININNVTATGTGATGDPQTVTFTFDPIQVNSDYMIPDDNNSFLLIFDAIVLNDSGNQHGDALVNNIRTNINGTVVDGAPATVNIIEPELNITKTASPTDPILGGEVTYQIVVSNPTATDPGDPPNAFELIVTDVIPTGLTYVANSADASGGSYNAATRTLTWTLGDLPTGFSTATLEYKVTVDAYPTNEIDDTHTNNATVTWSSLDGMPTIERDGSGGVNDYTKTDTVTTTVTNVDLSLTKDDGQTEAAPGDVLIYELDYINNGNTTATGVQITEVVPANTAFSAADSTAGWVCAPDGSAGNTCTYTIGDLAAGASGTVNFAVTIDDPVPTGVTNVINSASIADDGTHGEDPTAADNSDSDDDTINAAPDIAITKDDGETIISAGDTVFYTITVANNGDQDAAGVTVTDTLPDFVTFNASSSTSGWTCVAGGIPGDTCTFVIGALAGGGASTNVTLAVDVFDPFPVGYSTITNTASAADNGDNGPDSDDTNNEDDDTDDVDTSSALVKSITGTDQTETSGTDVAIGEVVSYSIRVTLPEGDFTAVQVVDNLPVGLQYVTDSLNVESIDFNGVLPTESLSVGAGSGGDLTIDFGAISVTVDNDDTNNSFRIIFDALVLNESANQNGITLTNNVSVSLNGGAVSNTDSADVTIVEPELTVSKVSNVATPNLDSTITYTITVEHLGGSTETAYDLMVTDTIPVGLTYVADSASPTASYDSGLRTLTWSGSDLPNDGSTLVLTYNVTIDSASSNPGDALTNDATLVWTSLDGEETGERTGAGGVNDYAASADDTVTFSTSDLYISKTDGLTQVQTGDAVSYTITYGNNGNLAATGVEITESVPENTTFNPGASTAGWVCAPDNLAGSTCTYILGTLGAGNVDDGALTFAVDVDDPVVSGATQLVNTATIHDDGSNGTDPTSDDNTSTDTDTLNAVPDIAISKTDGLTVVSANTALTYTLTVENLGDQDATGVTVVDTLPVDVTFVSAGDNPDGAAASYDSGTHTVTWPDFDLSAQAAKVLTISVTVNDPLTTTALLNTAEAHDDGSNGLDADGTNNTAEDIDNTSSLSKVLTDTSEASTQTALGGDENVTIGEIATYTVTFNVPAGSDMQNTLVTDHLGLGLAFVDCVSVAASSALVTTDIGGTPSSDFSAVCAGVTVSDLVDPEDPDNDAGLGRQASFEFGSVASSSDVDETITIVYRAVVLDIPENVDGGGLDNQVEITWTGGALSTGGTPALQIVEPDLLLSKKINKSTAAPGETVTYTLTVSHTADSTSNGFDLVLIDLMPAGVSYVPGTLALESGLAPTSLDENNPLELVITWDEFPLGQTAVLTFDAKVTEKSPEKEIINRANLAWTSLPGDVSTPQSVHNPQSTERWYDPAAPASSYISSTEVSFIIPALPDTGFAPGLETVIPNQPLEQAYTALDGLWLEIPRLDVTQPIIGVPLEDGEWNLTWLWDQVGYLEGTAFPTGFGNSAITGHVYLPNGKPGPFVDLGTLMWGDEIIVHMDGVSYIYQVQEVSRALRSDLSVLEHKDASWITLITCQGFNMKTGEYNSRLVVQAVLVGTN
ncbi:DUF11 domain-containing protein [bacterium]|nr:DUF11 domain-containing protein [bacterium]